MQAWHELTYDACQKQRADEQRKHLHQYCHQRRPEGHVANRVYVRQHHGHSERRNQVDDDGVAHQRGLVAAKTGSDHRSRRRRGADEAQHGTFNHHFQVIVDVEARHRCQHHEHAHLKQAQPQVPSAQCKFLDFHLAEAHQQHTEDEHRLNPCNGRVHCARIGFVAWNGAPSKIGKCARNHRDGQCPVLYELNYR